MFLKSVLLINLNAIKADFCHYGNISSAGFINNPLP